MVHPGEVPGDCSDPGGIDRIWIGKWCFHSRRILFACREWEIWGPRGGDEMDASRRCFEKRFRNLLWSRRRPRRKARRQDLQQNTKRSRAALKTFRWQWSQR
jgi:hypothetical protein